MRIGFISSTLGYLTGGSETIIREFARGLSRNHEVLLFTGKPVWNKTLQPQLSDIQAQTYYLPFLNRYSFINRSLGYLLYKTNLPGIKIYQGTFGIESLSFWFNFRCNRKIQEIVRTCDVISVHYVTDSLLYSNYCKDYGIPVVFHIPGDVIIDNFFKKDKSVLYIANSEATREFIETTYHLKLDGVVTPGIPKAIYDSYLPHRTVKNNKIMLYIGRIEKSKGIERLVTIFKELRKKYSSLRLIIVGKGNYENKLRQRISENNLADAVEIIGEVHHTQVFDYYRKADVFVHSSEIDSFAITLAEAMAVGVPIVCSDIPALRATTANTSILLDWRDISKWVEAIDHVLLDEDFAQQIIQNQRKRATDFFWENKSLEYERFLKIAIEKNRKS